MAYFREYRNKHGALIRRALIMTAGDKRKQRDRRLERASNKVTHYWQRRESRNWNRSIRHAPDPDQLRNQVTECQHDLKRYRARYYANLRYYYGAGPALSIIGEGPDRVFNYALSLRLDHDAIEVEQDNLRYARWLARRWGITL